MIQSDLMPPTLNWREEDRSVEREGRER